jgi:hypothetical protein
VFGLILNVWDLSKEMVIIIKSKVYTDAMRKSVSFDEENRRRNDPPIINRRLDNMDWMGVWDRKRLKCLGYTNKSLKYWMG